MQRNRTRPLGSLRDRLLALAEITRRQARECSDSGVRDLLRAKPNRPNAPQQSRNGSLRRVHLPRNDCRTTGGDRRRTRSAARFRLAGLPLNLAGGGAKHGKRSYPPQHRALSRNVDGLKCGAALAQAARFFILARPQKRDPDLHPH